MESSLLVMPLPKSDPQGYGSAMTYARRYALSAMLGMVTEDDDDGEAASRDRPAKQRAPRQPRPQQPSAASAQQATPAAPPPQPKPAETKHPALASLPRLDGVNYSTATAQDGRLCILASGNTSARKQLLSAAGFKWNAERKVWWRYAETA
ncbi:hypothetical protein DDE01_17960 [Desulfovibrio desulfuricans]|nr:hypothetical protein DDE01_17960 [Desulfovibrio desulfuricans]